jgi:hypothetical protein
MDSIVPDTLSGWQDGFLVAPSVCRVDHKNSLQMIDNNEDVSTAVEIVVYKSAEFNKSKYAPPSSH